MKKIIFLLVLILLMTSVVAFADQSNTVSYKSNEEINQVFDASNTIDERKWITNHSRFYERGTSAPAYIMYSDSNGFTGSLSLYYVIWMQDGIMAFYEGWVYRGTQPWSLTENK